MSGSAAMNSVSERIKASEARLSELAAAIEAERASLVRATRI